MTQNEKKAIAEGLRAYCGRMGSQNRAARSMNGVSTATVSKMLSGDWDTISDEMWRAVGAQTGRAAEGWRIVETQAYQRMCFLLESARKDSQVLAVTGLAGCGKTEAIKSYAAGHRNVYHLMCSEYWNRPTFMGKLLKAMGLGVGGTQAEQMDEIIDALKRAECPLIVLDEADKLRDQVLYFFITLYNQLEGHCGIVLCATDFLRKRVEKGVRTGRKGYEEIYSRLGRRFVQLLAADDGDIARVCRANGVEGQREIERIAAEAEGDLRRVKRAVWALMRKREEAAQG